MSLSIYVVSTYREKRLDNIDNLGHWQMKTG